MPPTSIGSIAVHKVWAIATDEVAGYDCLCVCLLVTFVSPAKMGEAMELHFGKVTRVGQRNHVLDGGQGPHKERGTFGGCLVYWSSF